MDEAILSNTPRRAQEQEFPSPLGSENPEIVDSLEGQDLSLRQAVRVLRKRKNVIIAATLGCTFIVLAVSLILRPYYASVVTIEIERDQSNPMDSSLGSVASSLGGMDDTKVEMETEVSVLQSDDLAIETMEKMDYEQHEKPYRLHLFGSGDRIASEKGLPLAQAPVTRKILLKRFSDHLKVAETEGTRLIQLTFSDPDPKYASDLASMMIDLYINDRLERRNSSTLQATNWMDGEISGMKKQVDATQDALIDFQQKSGLLALPSPAAGGSSSGSTAPNSGLLIRSPQLDRFVQLNQSLIAAETDRITREAIYRVAKSGNVDALAQMGVSMTSGTSAADPMQASMFGGLLSLRQQEVALKLQIASVQRIYGPNNPHMDDLTKQVAEIENQTKVEVKRIVDRSELDYQIAQKTEDGIREQYATELKTAYDVNNSQIHLAVLQEEADSMRMLYEDLRTKLLEAKLQIGMQAANIGLISRPLPQSEPSRPRPALYTFIAFAGGLFLGGVLAFVVENLDERLVTSVEIEEAVGVPVLSFVPEFEHIFTSAPKTNQSGSPEPSLPRIISWLIRAPRSQVAEAYRVIRTALLLSQPGSPPRVILVTSSLAAEGKSTTTYNLATSFALMGKRVLIIDADLRKPSIHRFVAQNSSQGLSNLLTGTGTLNEVLVQDEDTPALFVLLAGPIPPNPSELLMSDAFDKLLDKCAEEFEMVLIDSPPSMMVTDAAIISRKVDGTVLIARSGSTTRSVLKRVVQTFRRNKAGILGIVLNAVNTSSSEYYYEQGYYGGDGKGYYGNEKS